MTKNELSILVNEEVNKLLEANKDTIEKCEIYPNPLTIQLSTMATLQILQKYDIFPKCEE